MEEKAEVMSLNNDVISGPSRNMSLKAQLYYKGQIERTTPESSWELRR